MLKIYRSQILSTFATGYLFTILQYHSMTHYLQCNNCGHRNEMKSEYVVFCTSCGEKLDNNFTQWQRRNPGGTFEDFKRNACFTEEQLPPKLPIRKRRTLKSRSLKEKILIVSITTIFAAVGSWLGSTAVTALRNSKKTDEKVFTEQWVKKTYGSYGLTIETPWELQPSQSPPLQQNTENVIEKLEMFEVDKSKVLSISVVTTKYKPEIGEVNLAMGASGTINGMKNSSGISDLVYDQQEYSVNAIPGFIQRGTYQLQGVEIEFISIIVGKNLNGWQILVMNRKNDEITRKAAERIIQSIQINYPS